MRVLGALTVAVAVAVGVGGAGAAAGDTPGLRVVTVLPAGDDGARNVVAEVNPAPSGPPPPDAATVTADGAQVPATTAPLLAADAPVAVVVDGTAAGASLLPQALGGVTAFLLRLPDTTPVTVTADGRPPRALTQGPVSPAAAITALTGLRPGGTGSAADAVEVALGAPAASGTAAPARRRLLLLETTAAPPDGEAGLRLAERVRSARAVLAVVTTPGLAPVWASVAEATGGLARGATPGTASDAVDGTAAVLQARSVVTFTPPDAVDSVRIQLQAGAARFGADVALPAEPSPSAGSPSASSSASASASASSAASPAPDPGRSSPGRSTGLPVAGLAIGGVTLLALAVLGVGLAAWRRSRAPAARQPATVPAERSPEPSERSPVPSERSPEPAERSPEPDDGPVPGVRVFDVSGRRPVEIEPGQGERHQREPWEV